MIQISSSSVSTDYRNTKIWSSRIVTRNSYIVTENQTPHSCNDTRYDDIGSEVSGVLLARTRGNSSNCRHSRCVFFVHFEIYKKYREKESDQKPPTRSKGKKMDLLNWFSQCLYRHRKRRNIFFFLSNFFLKTILLKLRRIVELSNSYRGPGPRPLRPPPRLLLLRQKLIYLKNKIGDISKKKK